MWTFLSSGVLAATVVGNIVNNVNNNNNNNNNKNNQDNQNNNNQNINNNANSNMNMNMVNMAMMGRLLNNNDNNNNNSLLRDNILIKIICQILTAVSGLQARECLQRFVCETNVNAANSSDLTRFLHKTSRLVSCISHAEFSWLLLHSSISAGFIALDYFEPLDIETVDLIMNAVNTSDEDCHRRYPCIPFT